MKRKWQEEVDKLLHNANTTVARMYNEGLDDPELTLQSVLVEVTLAQTMMQYDQIYPGEAAFPGDC